MASPEAFQYKYPKEVSDVNQELAESVSNFRFALDDYQREQAREERLRQVFGARYNMRDGNQSFNDYTTAINGNNT